MNSKRRAELQRKLSLNAVPRPPAGLSDRIKADIPKYLDPATERSRFSSAIAFNMRVAASVLLAVTLVVTVYVINSPYAEKEAAVTTPGPFPPSGSVLSQTQVASSTTSAPARAQEARLDSARDNAAVPVPIAAMTPPPALEARESVEAPPLQAEAHMAQEETTIVGSVAGGVAGGVVGGAVGGVEGGVESDVTSMADRAAPRPFVAGREAEPAPAPAPAPPAAMMAETRRARTERSAASLGLSQSAQAKTMTQPRDEVFGISVDPGNFQRIRQTLESGGRPLPSAVDVEALVNYFAGGAEKRPKRGVQLDVEASPAPIEADGDHAILRFSIDTPDGAGAPIASNVRLEILFNTQVVASAKRAGGDEPLPLQPVLPYGTSVTGLYALELRPNLLSTQLVATVRLHYTSAATGREETLTRHVRGRDLAKGWQRATRRHRLAALGALWGESLKSSSGGVDVARRAEELATQDPDDALARELAEAASASAGGSR